MIIVFLLTSLLTSILSIVFFRTNMILGIIACVVTVALIIVYFFRNKISKKTMPIILSVGLVLVVGLNLFATIKIEENGILDYEAKMTKVQKALMNNDPYKAEKLLDEIKDNGNTSNVVIARAMSEYMTEEPDSCLKTLNNLNNVDKKIPLAYVLKGGSYLKIKEYKKAEETFTEAARLYPDWYGAQFFAGEQAIGNGNYEKGIYYLLRAIELNDSIAAPYYCLGVGYYSINEYDLATEYLNIAKTLDEKVDYLTDIDQYFELMEVNK